MRDTVSGNEIFITSRDGKKISILYYPSRKENAPLLVDVHGGGFVSGHHYSDDRLCSLMNSKLDINVATIEYRYAPEAVYPTATYDCIDALAEMHRDPNLDFDKTSVFLMGHSAGANIVAGMSILASCELGIQGQILVYPFLDAAINPRQRKHIRYSIPAFYMSNFNKKYFPDKPARNEPIASPVSMTELQVKRLPPTLLMTCSFDSLRADALKYAELLLKYKIPTRHIEYEGAVHGFVEMVSAGTIESNWWLGQKRITEQKRLFVQAIDDICMFILGRIKEITDI